MYIKTAINAKLKKINCTINVIKEINRLTTLIPTSLFLQLRKNKITLNAEMEMALYSLNSIQVVFVISPWKQIEWLTDVAHTILLEQRNCLNTGTTHTSQSFATPAAVDTVISFRSPWLLTIYSERLLKLVEINQLKQTTQ